MEIEVHAGWGNTDKIAVVGLPDTAVKEVRTGSPPPFPTRCQSVGGPAFNGSQPGFKSWINPVHDSIKHSLPTYFQ